MLYSAEEILRDVDYTLDQLLQNAAALEEIGESPLYSTEKAALEKLQESLLAHLMNMDDLMCREGISKKSSRELDRLKQKVTAIEMGNLNLLRQIRKRLSPSLQSHLIRI